MQATLQKYTLTDIREGMRVFKEQLSAIYDTWIILYRPKETEMTEDGIIGYIGAEPNEKSDALYNENNIIIPVYNDSTDLEGDIFDEE